MLIDIPTPIAIAGALAILAAFIREKFRAGPQATTQPAIRRQATFIADKILTTNMTGAQRQTTIKQLRRSVRLANRGHLDRAQAQMDELDERIDSLT